MLPVLAALCALCVLLWLHLSLRSKLHAQTRELEAAKQALRLAEATNDEAQEFVKQHTAAEPTAKPAQPLVLSTGLVLGAPAEPAPGPRAPAAELAQRKAREKQRVAKLKAQRDQIAAEHAQTAAEVQRLRGLAMSGRRAAVELQQRLHANAAQARQAEQQVLQQEQELAAGSARVAQLAQQHQQQLAHLQREEQKLQEQLGQELAQQHLQCQRTRSEAERQKQALQQEQHRAVQEHQALRQQALGEQQKVAAVQRELESLKLQQSQAAQQVVAQQHQQHQQQHQQQRQQQHQQQLQLARQAEREATQRAAELARQQQAADAAMERSRQAERLLGGGVPREQLVRRGYIDPATPRGQAQLLACQRLMDASVCGGCQATRKVTVLRVMALDNAAQKATYAAYHKEILARRWQHGLAPSKVPMDIEHSDPFGGALDAQVHEQILLHGTQERHLDAILDQGFDERLNRAALYGKGVYLTPMSCKALQYARDQSAKVVLVCRVLVGDAHAATRSRQDRQRPDERPGTKVLYDTTVAGVGTQYGGGGLFGGGGLSQNHQEVVCGSGRQILPIAVLYCQAR